MLSYFLKASNDNHPSPFRGWSMRDYLAYRKEMLGDLLTPPLIEAACASVAKVASAKEPPQ